MTKRVLCPRVNYLGVVTPLHALTPCEETSRRGRRGAARALRKYWRRPDIECTHHRRQIITTSEISKYTYGKCAPREPYNTMIKHDRPYRAARYAQHCTRTRAPRHIASKYINIRMFVNINFFISIASAVAPMRVPRRLR